MRIPSFAPFVAAAAALFPLAAQEPTPSPAPAPAAATDSAIPAPGTPAATQLLDKGVEKMLAIGRGTWKSHEAQDSAMIRGAGMPFGGDGTEVEGGWHQDLVWGETDHDRFVRHGGRMVVKSGDTWKLRASKLASGRPVPFTLDPPLLFGVLREPPAEARQIVHTEAAEVAGKQVVVLSLVLDGEQAADFVDSGVLPGAGGGMGGLVMLGGLGGGFSPPQPDLTVHLAFSVDPANGDVLRFAAKVYEKNAMFGNIQIQVQGAGGGGDEEADEEEEKEEKAGKDGDAKKKAPEWKHGLPARKPAKDESVMTFRADFTKLGLAAAPDLDDRGKALLRLR